MNNKKDEIRLAVAEYLSANGKAVRNRILDSLGDVTPLKTGILPVAQYNRKRELAAAVLLEMEKNGDIRRDSSGEYYLCDEKLVVVEQSKCRQTILALVKQKPLTKAELYMKLQKYFGTDKTVSAEDDNKLKSLAGSQLARLLQNRVLEFSEGKYSFAVAKKTVYPSLPVSADEIDRLLIQRLCEKDGAFFETFMGSMLEKYYQLTGHTVLDLNVRGGSDDGGIDILIETSDLLGFVETVAVQTKCRNNIKVTETEIRGFYGAMNAAGATRGIFVTTSSFHPAALKLLKSLKDCVGMDGKTVSEMARRVSYGVVKKEDGFIFNERVFDEQLI